MLLKMFESLYAGILDGIETVCFIQYWNFKDYGLVFQRVFVCMFIEKEYPKVFMMYIKMTNLGRS
jgi:hypothetical protein